MSDPGEVARHWGGPVPSHLKHGPQTRAAKVYGCDCRLCLPSGKRRPAKGQGQSARQRQRASRERLRGQPVPPHVRHGTYPYQYYRCRCDVCRAAVREARQRRLLRGREGWHGHWHEGPDTTTVHWPPRNLDEPWLCPDCGKFKVIPS